MYEKYTPRKVEKVPTQEDLWILKLKNGTMELKTYNLMGDSKQQKAKSKESSMNGTVYEHAPSTDLAVSIIMHDKDRPYIPDYSYILDKLRDADSKIKEAEQIKFAAQKKMIASSNKRSYRTRI